MRASLKILPAVSLLMIAMIAHADITIGNYVNGDCLPFNCNLDQTASSPLDYQQVYGASAFGANPITITSLTWYFATQFGGNGIMLPGNYTVFLSYTNAPVNGLSDNLPSNRGMDYTQVGAFVGGGSLNPSFTTATTPFNYNPALGNLLVEIFAANQPYQPNDGSRGYMEADTSGSVTSRAAKTPNFDYGPGPTGLVTTFGTGVATTPEPGTLVMFGSATLGLAGLLRRKINF
jgi:hypothetical protein